MSRRLAFEQEEDATEHLKAVEQQHDAKETESGTAALGDQDHPGIWRWWAKCSDILPF